ncbi:MAG: DinB family protein [Acidobacteria bacterium]|nr:DinB family protein [Acidobacteriota bacterium]
MDIAYIRTLYEYDRWANARVLDTVAKLSNDQFTKDMGSSMRSIRDTLVHILSGERVWLARWNGGSPRTMMDPTSLPTIEALRTAWVELEKEFAALLSSGARGAAPAATASGRVLRKMRKNFLAFAADSRLR